MTGTLYWDSLDPGCARLTVEFRNLNGVPLANQPAPLDVCGPGGDANNAANQRSIIVSRSSPNLFEVVIRTQEVRFDGTLVGGTGTTSRAPHTRRLSAKINSGTADFGSGVHVGGAPSGYAEIQFTRDNGTMFADVAGTLYWDALFSSGCARVVVDFLGIDGALLGRRTRDRCGPGGNANDGANQRAIDEEFNSGLLFQVRLRVGSLAGGSFVNVTTRTFPFQGTVGTFELAPAEAVVPAGEPVPYAFSWSVPEPLNWHDLRSLELRIRDDTETVFWVRFDEATGTFSLFNEAAGRFGHRFAVGSHVRLQSAHVQLDLADSRVEGSGPTGPDVTLSLALRFKPNAVGRTFRVEVAASDDEGFEDEFTEAGTVTVIR